MVKLSLKGFWHSVKIDRLRAHSLTLIFRHSALKNAGYCMLFQAIYMFLTFSPQYHRQRYSLANKIFLLWQPFWYIFCLTSSLHASLFIFSFEIHFHKTQVESVQLGKILDLNLEVFSFPLRDRVKSDALVWEWVLLEKSTY